MSVFGKVLGVAGGALAGYMSGGPMGAVAGGVSSAYAISQQKEQRKWQEEMANTEVQRRTKDLRAAGLNPILAVTNGSLQGASSPQVPVAQAPDVSRYTGTASAKQLANQNAIQVDSNVMLQRAQSASQLADVTVKEAQSRNLDVQNNLLNQQVLTEATRRANLEAQSGFYSAQSVRQRLQAVQDKVLADYFNTDVGAESARLGVDSKIGKLSPLYSGARWGAHAIKSLFDFGTESSAKGVQKVGREQQRQVVPRSKPNAYQQGLIDTYRR